VTALSPAQLLHAAGAAPPSSGGGIDSGLQNIDRKLQIGYGENL
jgi:hypothetical protein